MTLWIIEIRPGNGREHEFHLGDDRLTDLQRQRAEAAGWIWILYKLENVERYDSNEPC